MAHYTLASGKQTVISSVVCPTCCRRRVLETHPIAPLVIPLLALACSEDCAQRYLVKLRQLCEQQSWPAWKIVEHMQIVAEGFTTTAIAEAMAGEA